MMRWFINVAVCAVAATAFSQLPVIAKDWSLSAMHGGPRSGAMYQTPRWREAHETRQLRHRRRHYARVAAPELSDRYEHVRSYRPHVPGIKCEDKVRGLGTQWIGTQGAMDAARKDWMERVRYDLGEAYLDMTHAEDEVSRCGRVSVGETMGQVLYRCEIVARPCKAPFGETQAKK